MTKLISPLPIRRHAALLGLGLGFGLACGGGGAKTDTSAAKAPVITQDLQDQTASTGAMATFQVGATGAERYQWYLAGSPIAGATGASYAAGPLKFPDDNGKRFQVEVSGPGGQVRSREATLTVANPGLPPFITQDVQDATAAAGTTATFQVTGNGAQRYQWYRDGVALAGATAATYTTPVLAASDNGRKYKVDLANATATVTSREATLTVTAAVPGGTLGNDVGKSPYDVVCTDVQGNPRKLSDLRGKVVILEFSEINCDPCRRECPDLQKAYDTYKSRGLEVLQVIVKNEGMATPSPTDLQRWIDIIQREQNVTLTFPVVSPTGSDAERDYAISAYPITLVIDKSNVIRARNTGLSVMTIPTKLIESLLAQ